MSTSRHGPSSSSTSSSSQQHHQHQHTQFAYGVGRGGGGGSAAPLPIHCTDVPPSPGKGTLVSQIVTGEHPPPSPKVITGLQSCSIPGTYKSGGDGGFHDPPPHLSSSPIGSPALRSRNLTKLGGDFNSGSAHPGDFGGIANMSGGMAASSRGPSPLHGLQLSGSEPPPVNLNQLPGSEPRIMLSGSEEPPPVILNLGYACSHPLPVPPSLPCCWVCGLCCSLDFGPFHKSHA